jgi:spore coat polysaccharide biosynthesis protein SpsF
MALAIVQARISSTRLPAKVLAEVEGEPMLSLLLRRLSRATEVDRICVATSEEPDDDAVETAARESAVDVFRGPRDDVLTRFVGAARGHTGPIVRITADCPFIDPEVVDDLVRLFKATPGCAYASNIEPRSFPHGLDAEVFSPQALAEAAAEAQTASDREHVTPIMRRQLERFGAANLTAAEDLSELRWTVDTVEDLEFVRRVAARLGPRRHTAGLSEILAEVRAEPSLSDFRGRRG